MIKGIQDITGITGVRGAIIPLFILFYNWLDNILTRICREIARRD
jgi:hypothetical protein